MVWGGGTSTVTVDYVISNGTAEAGSDFTDPGDGTLTFLPFERTQSVSVVVNGDTEIESNETFSIILSNVNNTNVPIAVSNGTATILNDDFPHPAGF